MISMIIQGISLEQAAEVSVKNLSLHKHSEESVGALKRAMELAGSDAPEEKAIASLGEGWTAEEAMAIALYAALKHPEDYETALRTVVNQSGNSDGTGAICGNLLGAYLGTLEIPYRWMQNVELSELMSIGADRLLAAVMD